MPSMPIDNFSADVSEQLKWYVYRLNDPRNGETFYVGKGRGNRVFAHANGAISGEDEEISDPKLHRIRDIRSAGLDVAHVIHRHGIETPRVAYEVEAALIDAYPRLTNRVRGHGTKDYGSRHVEEINAEYGAEEFEVKEPLMLIAVGRSYYIQPTVYDAVRYAWKVNVDMARQYKLVLANLRGLVVGAFIGEQWYPADSECFAELVERSGYDVDPGRWGFVGEEAEQEIRDYYVRKRVPARYRRKGIQSPVLYCEPDSA